jgi:hypothetical protein
LIIEKKRRKKIGVYHFLIEEINEEITRRFQKSNLIMNIKGLPIEIRLKIVKRFFETYKEENEIKNLIESIDEKYDVREVLEKHSQKALIRSKEEINELI